MAVLDLGPIGIAVEIGSNGGDLDEASAFEKFGYRTMWIPGGQIDRLERVEELTRATASARVATAILSPDVFGPDEVATFYSRLESTAPGQLLVGLGGTQRGPSLPALHDYLDRLDSAGVPKGRRILAALGPRKLGIARDRCAGAITLLVTPEFTSSARAVLGPDATLVVDQFVVLGTDPQEARSLARSRLEFLARVPGYRSNFVRMGFTDDEIRTLDDRLVDALVIWGDVDTIAEGIDAQRTAGADHVVLTLLIPDCASADGLPDNPPGRMEIARQLAARLVIG